MATQWYYARGGQQLGPVAFDELQRMAARGELAGGDLVWSEGMSNWSPASSVANLMPAEPGAGYPQQPTGAPMPPAGGEPPQRMVQAGTGLPATGYQGPAMGMQLGYGGGAPGGPPPPNYLVQAILVTLCCCIPFGIPAIVYAAQVNGKFQAGDYPGAVQSSEKAKFWCWMAFGIGLVANLIGIGIQIAVNPNLR